jgi:hypothetical protein
MDGNLLEVGHPYWTQGEGSGLWPFNKHTNVYAASLVVKTGPGKLYGFTVYNSGAGQFLQVHDGSTVPANGAIPAFVLAVAATSNMGAYFGDVGRAFDTGCVIVNSSTGPTLTIGAADCFIDAQFL